MRTPVSGSVRTHSAVAAPEFVNVYGYARQYGARWFESVASLRPDELERRLQEGLRRRLWTELEAKVFGRICGLTVCRTNHVLRFPDFDRADRIGEFWSYP